ncbi:predicted protein [Sclerotinia sclerotiorum 1980 UF-70]|uniref:Uncharacterized protein n=1 Tax=Sclerotinia sclerotiorum (strain ATCC 18683 / 1980 / Ss-1) TaxID=665079 RepID=A7EGC4_SCLS1|nr:predicted protein [Sclerotinia sclerotiorum 1980 UF-70]EDO01890.1 predicted protein [Sclerotinia sclerotiorum 1980 UF-70]
MASPQLCAKTATRQVGDSQCFVNVEDEMKQLIAPEKRLTLERIYSIIAFAPRKIECKKGRRFCGNFVLVLSKDSRE